MSNEKPRWQLTNEQRAYLSQQIRERVEKPRFAGKESIPIDHPELQLVGTIKESNDFTDTPEPGVLRCWTWEDAGVRNNHRRCILAERVLTTGIKYSRDMIFAHPVVTNLATVVARLGPPKHVGHSHASKKGEARWHFQVRWTDESPPVSVPVEQVFTIDGVEKIELPDYPPATTPLGRVLDYPNRPALQVFFRAPWSTIKSATKSFAFGYDFFLQAQVSFDPKESTWTYHPAWLEDDAVLDKLPEVWRNQILVLARQHRRTIAELRWMFIIDYLRGLSQSVSDDYGFNTDDGLAHVLSELRSVAKCSVPEQRYRLGRRDRWEKNWRREYHLIVAMMSAHCPRAPEPLDPRLYADFKVYDYTSNERQLMRTAQDLFCRTQVQILEVLRGLAELEVALLERTEQRRKREEDKLARKAKRKQGGSEQAPAGKS